MKHVSVFVLAALLGACASPPATAPELEAETLIEAASPEATIEDPHKWLEDVYAPEALAWVEAHNEKAFAALTESPLFAELDAEALAILTNKDRIPDPSMIGDDIYNFWQDDVHVRGVWRRTDPASFNSGNPEWETVLDVDALSEAEGQNWVYEGARCYGKPSDRCMVELSPGGTDSSVYREFSLTTKSFVENGFVVPEAKSNVSWLDADTLMVGTDWGDGAMTQSGYARDIRIWHRGEDLAEAKSVFEGAVEDTLVAPFLTRTGDADFPFILRLHSDWNVKDLYRVINGEAVQVDVPQKSDTAGIVGQDLLLSLEQDWERDGFSFRSGDIIAVPLNGGAAKLLFRPKENQAVRSTALTEKGLLLNLLEDVKGRLVMLAPGEAGWTARSLPVPDNSTVKIVAASNSKPDAYVTIESFTQPNTLYLLRGGETLEKAFSLPELYDASDVKVEQRWATSSDGVQVPYFLVGKASVLAEGNAPAILYGYGGFTSSMLPVYYEDPGRPQHGALAGKMWISRGGVLAISNLRGGGEFGPNWHQAALRENRQKAFDDYYAIAEDMIAAGVTSADRLGALGRSNGGLLLGVALTQRPDLFAAFDIGVPLFDMIEFTQLGAGASWIGEYGDPRVPEDRVFIEKYSPYQNLDPDAGYPTVFFYTSTQDDRVHPGHARKAAARLEEYGKDVLYYENTEGGHGGTANQDQLAYRTAMEYAYFMRQLMPGVTE
ncbi:MAG: prolyl oligopeptidase family serine peptidase [Hyphomonas sp.]|uniref:prolyl oligopeptidase family serine peptidase n=1 Tax=Hyphomonas sp. TaxID=87 RepID=UPI0035292EA2